MTNISVDSRARPAPGSETGPRRRNVRRVGGAVALNGILVAVGAAYMAPLAWLFTAAFDANATASVRIPNEVTAGHFTELLNWARLRPLYNSLYLAGVTTLLSTVVATLAAYCLSREQIPFKRMIMFTILFASSMPVVMLLVPVYQMYVTLHWVDSLLGTSAFLAATSVPFAIWLLKNFFDQIPSSFEEAAAIEGAGSLVILARVILPMAWPGIAVSAMVTFVHAWSAFAIPLVLNSNPRDVPGAIAIYQFLTEQGVVQWGGLAAYSLLFALPVLAVYFLAARHVSGAFVQGGGLKG